MPIGEQLVKARISRKLTASEVAAATRMKVQIVEALEREDFDKIAAPIYGKGFIRLYAEYVGLDPKPLIDEYMMRFVSPPPEPVFDDDLPPEELDLNTASNRKVFFGRQEPISNNNKPDKPNEQEILTQPPEKDTSVKIQLPQIASDQKDNDLFSGVNVREANDFQVEDDEPSENIFPIAGIIREIIAFFRGIPERLGIQTEETEMDPDAKFLNMTPLRSISTLLIVLIILVVFGSAFSKCIRKTDQEQILPTAIGKDLNVAIEPPDSYLD